MLGTVATLLIGRVVVVGRRKGRLLPIEVVARAIARRRAGQIGPNMGLTVTAAAGGYYQSRAVPSVRAELLWWPNAAETHEEFRANMQALAQALVQDLGQQEVIVTLNESTIDIMQRKPPAAPGPSCDLDAQGDPVPRARPGAREPDQALLDRLGYVQQGPSCNLDEHGDPIPVRYRRSTP